MKKRCPDCLGIFHAHRDKCPEHGALEAVSVVPIAEREGSADAQQIASVLRQAASLSDAARGALSPLRVYVAPTGPLSIEGVDGEREPHALDDALYAPHDASALRVEQARAYRLAAFAYALLAGAPAFFARTPKAVLVRKRLERAPSLAEARPELAPAVRDAIQRALDRDPTLDEPALRAALRAIADAPLRARAAAAPVPAGIAPSPMGAAPPAPLGAPSARSRTPVVALALIGVAATLALGAGALLLTTHSEVSRDAASAAHEEQHLAPMPATPSAPMPASTAAVAATATPTPQAAEGSTTAPVRGSDESTNPQRPTPRASRVRSRPRSTMPGSPPRAPTTRATASARAIESDDEPRAIAATERAPDDGLTTATTVTTVTTASAPSAAQRTSTHPGTRRARAPAPAEPRTTAPIAPAAPSASDARPAIAASNTVLQGAQPTSPPPEAAVRTRETVAPAEPPPRPSRAPWALGIIAALAALGGALALALRGRTQPSAAPGASTSSAPSELLATRVSVLDTMHATIGATIPASHSGAVDALARTEFGASGRGSQPSTLKTHTDFQPFAIGAYQCVEPLGEGAMGIVYKARDQRTGALCAVKVLVPDLAAQPDAARQFRREAELAASVKHPNTVIVYDFGELDGGMLYLVMELLDGATIDAVLRRRALAPNEALEWTRQLCAGLDALHAAGIVHQDLKPQNVMVIAPDSSTPVVKIVDFGLARLVAEPIETSAGTRRISGTPLYMAPEQARADDYVGPSADLFSLGVVTYEMLCGSIPFDVDHYTVPQVVLERATGQYRIRSVRAASQGRASSSQLDVLFGHALAVEPARRPKSANEFYEQMRDALAA